MTLELTLDALVAGKRVIVMGSAPNPSYVREPVDWTTDPVWVGVGGGISRVPTGVPTIWVLNARHALDPVVCGNKQRLHQLMLKQGANRRLDLVIFASKGTDAERHALERLKRQGTTFAAWTVIDNETRRALERQAGGRDDRLSAHALSLGMFAVCVCLDAGAARVELAGFSWTGGYHYTDVKVSRGHEAGDKRALALLLARYPSRLHTTLSTPPRGAAAMSTKKQTPKIDETPVIEETPTAPKGRRVRATKLLQYDLRRRRPGEVFLLRVPGDFKASCMVRVPDTTPLRTLSAAEAASISHRQLLADKAPMVRQRLAPNAADILPDPEEPDPVEADLDVIG